MTIGAIALILGTVISNSATANLLIPIAITLAMTVGIDPIILVVVVALICGLGMALPISTPPNAIAYATGEVSTGQMASVGASIGLLGLFLITVVMPPIWSALGLLS